MTGLALVRGGQLGWWCRLALARGGVELRLFFREPEAVLGTFGPPVLLLAMLGTIFGEQARGAAAASATAGDAAAAAASVTAGIMALGVGGAAFIGLGLGVATDRDDGTLARLRRVPAPASVYVAGKTILVLVTSVTSAALLLGTGMAMFGLAAPADPRRWLTLGWVLLLGVTACSLLGVTVSQLARTVRAANALMNLPFLALAFLSGLLVPVSVLPPVYQNLGALFPLKWLGQGFRSALLPNEMAVHEVAGAWEHGRTALVLAAWCIGGLVLCLTTFRWRSPRDG